MSKHLKKAMGILLGVCVLLSGLTIPIGVSAAVKMETFNGFLRFEAEDTNYNASYLAVAADSALYSNGKALKVTKEFRYTGDTAPITEAADIDLTFKADVTGTYTIWMRNTASVADQAGQSVYFAYGTGNYAWTKLGGEIGKPAWTKLCTMSVNAGDYGAAKLRVRQSKDINFDQFIITNNASFTPDGIAPVATQNGFLNFEAESTNYNTAALGTIDNSLYSGGTALKVLKDFRFTGDTAPITEAADIDLSFMADIAGTYTVWMRNTASVADAAGQSIYFAYGTGNYAWTKLGGEIDTPEWTKLCVMPLTAGQKGIAKLKARQTKDIRFDRFIITSDTSFVPGNKLTMVTKDGKLSFEAEETAYNAATLAPLESKIFSGGTALTIPQEFRFTGDTAPITEAADIDLSFKADVAGTYTVWMRNTASVADAAGQSIYFGYGTGNYVWTKLNGEVGKPAWTKLCSMNLAIGQTGVAKLKARQNKEIRFDSFIITNDTSYTPDDLALGIRSLNSIFTTNGSTVFEAETLQYNTAHFSLVQNNANMSGNAGLAALVEDKTVPATTAPADIDLGFKADKKGTYNVWVRNTGSSGGNSVFVSIAGGAYAYQTISIGATTTTYVWTKLGSVTVSKAGDIASVRLSSRQKYDVTFDKFIITNNTSFTPTDAAQDPSIIVEKPLPSGVYATPTILPPANTHPRLLFKSSDIPTIVANMNKSQNAAAKTAWQSALASTSNGIHADLPAGTSNYTPAILDTIEAKAFDYAINGNTTSGNSAIAMFKNVLDTANFTGDPFEVRALGHLVFTGAKVYDWCYPLISANDKVIIRTGCESYATGLSIGYPPNKMGSVTGHGSEGQLLSQLLSLGVATYDERPDIYNYVAGRFFADYVEPRNYWYQSGSYHQGSGYVGARFFWDIHAAMIFKRMANVDVFSADMKNVFYEAVYRRRPDGEILRTGDDYNEYGNTKHTFWGSYNALFFYGANYFNDPYLKYEYQRGSPTNAGFYTGGEGGFTGTLALIFNNPDLNGQSVSTLPKTMYSPSPKGQMIAKTGWNMGMDSPDVMAYMNIGERWGSNHDHLDSGHFQLYYKGILASDSGYYGDGYGSSHDYNYHKRGIAHNIITVYDPNEVMTYNGPVVNDGGQRSPNGGTEPSNLTNWMNDTYKRGEVIGTAFGPDATTPEYSYLAGDITKAYSTKISEALRSMVLLPLEDASHPATFVVFDKVTSSNASFKKSWLLHMQEAPQVSGNKTIVKRTADGNNGRMVNETLLPAQVNITSIGGAGQQFMIGGTNYGYTGSTASAAEAGWGRVEVSPASSNATDYFLNVMTVSDANTAAVDLTSTLIEGSTYAGAVISNRVAIFAKDKARLTGTLSFTVPGTGSFKMFVAGLQAGTWKTSTGEQVTVTQAGGVAYFTAPAGAVTLTKL